MEVSILEFAEVVLHSFRENCLVLIWSILSGGHNRLRVIFLIVEVFLDFVEFEPIDDLIEAFLAARRELFIEKWP